MFGFDTGMLLRRDHDSSRVVCKLELLYRWVVRAIENSLLEFLLRVSLLLGRFFGVDDDHLL